MASSNRRQTYAATRNRSVRAHSSSSDIPTDASPIPIASSTRSPEKGHDGAYSLQPSTGSQKFKRKGSVASLRGFDDGEADI